ncbi:MAG: hypothetical protein AAFW97_14480 [Pseudomonadota bacterium]
MAWQNGLWVPEENDVQEKVLDVAKSGSPLMKQARGLGMAIANDRGLGNSSIAAGEVQARSLDTAFQIGSQQSAQTHAKNLAALQANEQFRYGTTLQEMSDEAAEERLRMSIKSAEKISGDELRAAASLQANDLAAQMQRLQAQFEHSDRQQQAEIGAQMQQLEKQIAANTSIASLNNAAAAERLAAQISSNEKLTAIQAASRMAELELQVGAEERLQDTRGQQAIELQNIQGLQQQQLQAEQIKAAQQEQVQQSVTSMVNIQQQMLASITNSPDIPASARAAYEQNAQRVTESNIGLIEQIYNVDLKWGNNGLNSSNTKTTNAAPKAPAAPAPPAAYIPKYTPPGTYGFGVAIGKGGGVAL